MVYYQNNQGSVAAVILSNSTHLFLTGVDKQFHCKHTMYSL